MAPASPRLFACLVEIVEARLPDGVRPWFEAAVVEEAVIDPERFGLAFAAAPRRLGRMPVSVDGDERRRLFAFGPAAAPDGWRLDQLARVAWLVGAADALPPEALERRVEVTWRRGDSLVAQAVLRALPLLPRPERFLALALEGGRSSLRPVLEALACDNPFPAAQFHEVHFNEIVVKAIAADIAPERIVGIQARMNADLLRLTRAHVALRRASGRSVPAPLQRFAAGIGSAA